ncbi:hypothetical protein J31TS4_26250 [Paenibacillus sp. J31TS4]|uniref:thiol-disulfide oxidoreductase DCC family protein n=1 Tax=Paenibacillus sp. J31TS4 TaxID=2807195 RepID=UPI001B20FF78|nr:thiol-disulfide oxidoreductase DCC family protein [Paenibacillus sp. J31TS4]GIP39345.1 hypothetical protein J31TS4_26250 [Paenibacillus sp. J31TS4]
MMQTEGPVVLFDGVCSFCHASVRFLLKRDSRGVFRFAARQSQAGQAYAERFPQLAKTDSVALVAEGRCYTESAAALRIGARLGGPWRLLAILLLVPRPLRDGVYRWVARNRYRWFGQTDACVLPAPGVRDRFLEDAE